MKKTLKRTKQALMLGATLLCFAFGQTSLAQGNSGNANGMGNGNGNGNSMGKGNGRNLGVGNASDGISAEIRTSARVIYTGNPLEIAIRFRRGAELINDGTIDASLVVFSPNFAELDDEDDAGDSDETEVVDLVSDAIVLPIESASNDEEEKLFEIEAVDIATLPAGTYQIGLILTVPDGNPLVINDWYRGLLGLETIIGLTITDEAVPFDQDGDGEIDDDSDGDGLSDDDEEIEFEIEFVDDVTGIEGKLEYEVDGSEQELELEIDDAAADTVYDIVLVFGDTDVAAGSATSDEDGEFDFELDSSDDDEWLELLPEGSDLSDLTGVRVEQDGEIVLSAEFGADDEATSEDESDESDDDDSEDEEYEEDESDDDDSDDSDDDDDTELPS